MQKMLQKTLDDIVSIDVLLFVFKVSLLALLSTTALLWLFWEEIVALIGSFLGWIAWDWLQTSGASIIALVGGYILFTLMMSIFTALFSEPLLIKLAKKHYPIVPVIGSPSLTKSLLITLKASGVFIALFILLSPLLFIPIIGQIVILYLWSILLKDPTVYDVGSLFIADEQRLQEKSKKSRTIAMIGALFNYIPFLNIFAPIFAQILFLHHILGEKR
jgi:hypothetical protein